MVEYLDSLNKIPLGARFWDYEAYFTYRFMENENFQ